MSRLSNFVVALAFAAIVGAAAGGSVAGIEWVAFRLLTLVRDEVPSIVVLACIPTLGLATASYLLIKFGQGASSATADAYFLAARRQRDIDPWPLPARVGGVIATLGTGGAMGFEGPAIYIGASIASVLRRFAAVLGIDASAALAAGAAGAIGGLFQQPFLGAVAAIDLPYRNGIDTRRLPYSIVGGLAGWQVFGPLRPDYTQIIPDVVHVDLSGNLIGAALLVGIAASVVARLFALLIIWGKQVSAALVAPLRVACAGGAMAALVLAAHVIAGTTAGNNLAVGPGSRLAPFLLGERPAVLVVVSLLAVRMLATSATIAGGGIGGLFVPMLSVGAGVGVTVGGWLDGDASIAAAGIVGAGACLAVGYQSPLTGIAFIAGVLGPMTGLGLGIPAVVLAVALGQGVRVTNAQGDSPRPRPEPPKRRRQSVFTPDDRDASGEWVIG
jgi:chloride channel protein, CIC family